MRLRTRIGFTFALLVAAILAATLGVVSSANSRNAAREVQRRLETGALQAQTRANMAIFTEAFRMFNPFAAAAAAKAQEESAAAGAAKGDDLGDLKRELSEMRDRLDKLAKTK